MGDDDEERLGVIVAVVVAVAVAEGVVVAVTVGASAADTEHRKMHKIMFSSYSENGNTLKIPPKATMLKMEEPLNTILGQNEFPKMNPNVNSKMQSQHIPRT